MPALLLWPGGKTSVPRAGCWYRCDGLPVTVRPAVLGDDEGVADIELYAGAAENQNSWLRC